MPTFMSINFLNKHHMRKITLLLTLLVSYAGFAQFPAPYCGPLTFTNGVEPITSVNFAGIVNTSSATVGAASATIIAHEDYTAIVGSVSAGVSYPITLKGNTDGAWTTRLRLYADWNHDGDFLDTNEVYDLGSIYNSTGTDAVELTANVAVPADALTGSTRIRITKKFSVFADSCNSVPTTTNYGQAEDYTLTVSALSADLPDYVNLQFPYTATINIGGSTTVYGRVYEGGLTDTTTGQAPGIQAWVGISPLASNTNPNTWTNWIPATFNVETDGNNNDEYQANIGANLTVTGTYYYATRFKLNNGAYVYGGINFGAWDATTHPSGVLTVNGPANDDCSGATTVTCGSSTLGTTSNANNENMAVCGISGVTTQNSAGVWYKYAGDGNEVTVTTCSTTITTGDSRIAVYSGTCGSLTCIGGNDDAQAAGCVSNALSSVVSFNTVTGTDYYILVYSYTLTSPGTNAINFQLNVSCVAPCTPATSNDDCATALPITVGATATATNNLCSSPSLNVTYPTCGNQFGTYYDTWYSFDTANATDFTIVLTSSAGTTGFAVYSGACGTLTMVTGACSVGAGTVLLTGLTTGTTYYIRAFSTAPSNRGTYNLSVSQTLATGAFDASSFSYYPNPVKNILTLSYSQEISNVEVFNLLGQKVFSNKMNANSVQVDMSNLPKGAYIVKVASDNQVKTIKVMKE